MNASSLHRTFTAFVVFTLASIGGIALAHHAEHGKVNVTELSGRDIVEKLDGKDATVVEVTFEPGQQDTPTSTPARSSVTSSRASTSTRSTTGRLRDLTPATRFTNRRDASIV
jgi:hypothetical protein